MSRGCGCGRGCGCNGMNSEDEEYGMGGRMHRGMGMGNMYMHRAPSNKVLKEKLELYKEELGEEIKYIEKRISELEKKGDDDDEDEGEEK